MKKVFVVTAVLALLSMGGIAHAITIDMVTVGDAGNAADTRYNLEAQYHHTAGYGAVGYNYNIGKYEVTAGQYTAFLNAVGGVDTYALYNPAMDPVPAGLNIAADRSEVSFPGCLLEAIYGDFHGLQCIAGITKTRV